MKQPKQHEWDREDRFHPTNLKALSKTQLPSIKHKKQIYDSLYVTDDLDDEPYSDGGEEAEN